MIYKKIIHPIVKANPAKTHKLLTHLGAALSKTAPTRAIVRHVCFYRHPALRVTIAGIKFENPLGLAADFDTKIRIHNILSEVGFGFAEFRSTIAQDPQAHETTYDAIYEDIFKKHAHIKFKIPVGFTIGNAVSTQDMTTEVLNNCKAYDQIHPLGDYTTINVNIPTSNNQTVNNLQCLELFLIAIANKPHTKPIFLKIGTNISQDTMLELIKIVDQYSWVTGYNVQYDEPIPNNSSIDEFLAQLERIKFMHAHTNKIIIACGGSTGQEVYELLDAGASLVHVVGLLNQGPRAVSKISRELVSVLHKNGHGSIEMLFIKRNKVDSFTE